MSTDDLLAWLLPLFSGCGLWWLANGSRRFRGDVAASVGAGWLIGVFLAAFCARWRAEADTLHAVREAAPWLIGVGVVAWMGAAWRLRGRASIPPIAAQESPARHWRVFWWLLLALVLLRLGLLGMEVAMRPIFPWDAWSAWAVKPKAWILLGRADAYVPMSEWLAQPWAPTRTMLAWKYPELLAWVEVWFASGAGGWNEPQINFAWLGALTALALAMYGYTRGLGLPAWQAMALTYALVSLPLLDAHVALAGYADLWIAATLGIVVLGWTRWLVFREPGLALLSAALALCLPSIKLEGSVWMMGFFAIALMDTIPGRWRWRIAIGSLSLLALGVILGGFSLLLPGMGHVTVDSEQVTIAGVATYQLSWHAVGGEMLESLFTLPNWHLLWYALPLLIALRWRSLLSDCAARWLGGLVMMQFLFLFLLFTVTNAAQWAQDFTSANRLLLQIVPTAFVFAALLLRGSGKSPTQVEAADSSARR